MSDLVPAYLLPGYAHSVIELDVECRRLMVWFDQQLDALYEQIVRWEPQPCPEYDFVVYYQPVVASRQRWFRRYSSGES